MTASPQLRSAPPASGTAVRPWRLTRTSARPTSKSCATTPALQKADVDGRRAHDDVIDGEDETRGIHDHPAAHALVAEDARGRMRLGHQRVQIHHGPEQMARELDGDVHHACPPR